MVSASARRNLKKKLKKKDAKEHVLSVSEAARVAASSIQVREEEEEHRQQQLQKSRETEDVPSEVQAVFDAFAAKVASKDDNSDDDGDERTEPRAQKQDDVDPPAASGRQARKHQKGRLYNDDDDLDDLDDQQHDAGEKDAEKGGGALTQKQRKQQRIAAIAKLKQVAPRPDLVEIWDTTAKDPVTLVHLKGVRNSVPIPRHWSAKRKYLQGKRGLEKPPFQLPQYIQATGIEKLREVLSNDNDSDTLKKRTRDRRNARVAKLDLDYQVLHDAFFRYQTRVQNLTGFGDLYYEGKEFEEEAWTHQGTGDDTSAEAAAAERPRAGRLSFALRAALGMPVPEGHERSIAPTPGSVPWWEKAPPPYLRQMQRYGPPPAYPALRIPGVNAPLPPGCEYGNDEGKWGTPPVDANGVPLYGDVYGEADIAAAATRDPADTLAPDEKNVRWGALEILEEDEDEEEDEEEEEDLAAAAEEEDAAEDVPDDIEAPMMDAELRAGIASAGFDLRKDAAAPTPLPPSAQEGEAPALYRVLETRAAAATAPGKGPLLGTEHTYVIPDDAGDERVVGADNRRGAGSSASTKRKAEPKPSSEQRKKKARGGDDDEESFKF